MKHLSSIIIAIVLFTAISFGGVRTSNAQFSQVVVVLKGTVRADESARPIAVKVSVRSVGDTATEITSSRSNSETGNYLVVLKPGKKYWFHFEGNNIMTKDTMVETPQATQTQQVVHDFTVVTRELDARGATPLDAKANDAKATDGRAPAPTN